MKKKNKQIAKLAQPAKAPVWVVSKAGQPKEVKLMSDLSDSELQDAYSFSQEKEIGYHNRTITYLELQEQLEEEANRRGFKLKSLEEVKPGIGEYFVHNKILRNSK